MYNTRTDTGFTSLNLVDFESKIEESAIFEYVVFYELKSTMDFLPKAASIIFVNWLYFSEACTYCMYFLTTQITYES